MAGKRYQIKTSCPQCGCTELTVLSEEEIREKYGDDPRFRMSCGECAVTFEADRSEACPEWDESCRLRENKR